MMEWSYWVFTLKNPQVASLQEYLTVMGADGWELAATVTTVKSWANMTGNDLVFIFKKPGAGQVAPGNTYEASAWPAPTAS